MKLSQAAAAYRRLRNEPLWRLLTDPEQNAVLEEAIEEIFRRTFSARLDGQERRFLMRLKTLLEQDGSVHEVVQQFARSLKQFVQSREYLE